MSVPTVAPSWLSAMRPHHWSKNLLVFLPLLAAQRLDDPGAWKETGIVFVAFCLCASGAYLFNDWIDREDDARHPLKRERAVASGRIPARTALAGAITLPLVAVGGTWAAGSRAWPVLLSYALAATAYTLWMKRWYLVDVMTLAGLYVLRLAGGAVAAGITLSPWLLGLAGSVFATIALAKRLAEIAIVCRPDEAARVPGRPYGPANRTALRRLGNLGATVATTVLIAYPFSPNADRYYAAAWPLWLVATALGYWLFRLLELARRGQLHIDPVVFAAGDRLTLALAGVCLAVLGLAGL